MHVHKNKVICWYINLPEYLCDYQDVLIFPECTPQEPLVR